MHDEAAPHVPAAVPDEKRFFTRHALNGASFDVRAPTGPCEIRLKDISGGGASGLLCDPVRIGDFIVIEFDARHQVEAEVCRVRRFLVGVKFTRPLSAAFVERLCEKYAPTVPVDEDHAAG